MMMMATAKALRDAPCAALYARARMDWDTRSASVRYSLMNQSTYAEVYGQQGLHF
jgi:hypothetical protein